ncbi:MAG: hypothetical protein HY403_07820 [Elusimicrobia bacterium]|nr:hypothetical protein [Elusimicrobiota bacterium]
MRFLLALGALGWSAAGEAQSVQEVAALLARHPALVAAPAPVIARMHQVGVSSSNTSNALAAPTGYAIASAKQVIANVAAGILSVRSETYARNAFVSGAGGRSPELHDYETIGQVDFVAVLGGLLHIPVQSRSDSQNGPASIRRFAARTRLEAVRSVEGTLFPLEAGGRMRVAIASSLEVELPRISHLESEIAYEFVVIGREPMLERNGMRIDGGIVRIEETSRQRLKGSGFIERRKTHYYSEKYRWVVASDDVLGTSTGGGGATQLMPVFAQAVGAAIGAAELERFDHELVAIQRRMAQEYLEPRLAPLAALVPGALGRKFAGDPTSGNSLVVDCGRGIGHTVRRSLLAYGLSYLAENADNFLVQAVAGGAADAARRC